MTTEEWVVIPGFSRYEAHPSGRIRNYGWREIKGTNSGGQKRKHLGYMRVRITADHDDGPCHKARLIPIHVLIALTFLGPCPPGHQRNHKDGNKLNNSVENLEYVTASQNQQHASDTGLRIARKGSEHGRSKLTEAIVLDIRRVRAGTQKSYREIATLFGVSIMTVCFICNRKTWRHI